MSRFVTMVAILLPPRAHAAFKLRLTPPVSGCPCRASCDILALEPISQPCPAQTLTDFSRPHPFE